MVKNLTPLGKMTVFYIPSHKLDAPGPVGQHTPRGPRAAKSRSTSVTAT